MSANRYQITTDTEGSKPGQTIKAGLTWEEASSELLTAPSADIDYALASLSHSGTYSFLNSRGELSRIVLHRQPS